MYLICSDVLGVATTGDVSWDVAKSFFGTSAAVLRASIHRDFVDGFPIL